MIFWRALKEGMISIQEVHQSMKIRIQKHVTRGGNYLKLLIPRHFWVQFYIWNPGNISVFVECFVFTPVPGVWKFEKSLYKGQNQKSSKVGGVTYQNLCEKGTKPTKKTRAQSDLPVKRKIRKTSRKNQFPKKTIFRLVFWIFLLTGKSDWALVFFVGLVPFSHKFW